MPRTNIRKYRDGHISQQLSAQALRFHSQATVLVVGQPQPAVAELFAEHAILLAQIVDRKKLALVHPACQGGQQEAERVKELRHWIASLFVGEESKTAAVSSRSNIRAIWESGTTLASVFATGTTSADSATMERSPPGPTSRTTVTIK